MTRSLPSYPVHRGRCYRLTGKRIEVLSDAISTILRVSIDIDLARPSPRIGRRR